MQGTRDTRPICIKPRQNIFLAYKGNLKFLHYLLINATLLVSVHCEFPAAACCKWMSRVGILICGVRVCQCVCRWVCEWVPVVNMPAAVRCGVVRWAVARCWLSCACRKFVISLSAFSHVNYIWMRVCVCVCECVAVEVSWNRVYIVYFKIFKS